MDDLVSDIIKKFRDKTNFKEAAKFIFNAKNLVGTLNLAEAGITPNANIFVIPTKYIKGAKYTF